MIWPAYDTYKSTGQQWLRESPAHWELRPLGFHFTERKTTVSAADYTPLSVTKAGIVPQLDTAAKTDNPENRKFVTAGDFVINSRSDRKGSAGVSDRDGSVSVISTVLELRQIEAGFVHHLLRSRAFQEEYYRFGSGIVADLWSTRYSAMKQITLAVPPRSEQCIIASFLDRETAKIDALIDKQEQLIATLREDRAATITQAVTKGLDPDTNFSPSGIDWISEIPDHWSHSRIGYACNLLTGFPFRSEGFTDDSDELPLLRGLNVGVQSIDWSSVVYWPRSESAELHPYRLQIGDIVVGLDRPFIGAGTRVAQIGAQDVPSLLLQRVLRLRATDEFENRYVAYLLSGQGFVDHLTPMFTGVSVPHISPGQVASFAIPKPPVHEQRKIIDFLDGRCAKIDALIGKSTDMIETLREYRSALITNAVTGKIDVREAV